MKYQRQLSVFLICLILVSILGLDVSVNAVSKEKNNTIIVNIPVNIDGKVIQVPYEFYEGYEDKLAELMKSINSIATKYDPKSATYGKILDITLFYSLFPNNKGIDYNEYCALLSMYNTSLKKYDFIELDTSSADKIDKKTGKAVYNYYRISYSGYISEKDLIKSLEKGDTNKKGNAITLANITKKLFGSSKVKITVTGITNPKPNSGTKDLIYLKNIEDGQIYELKKDVISKLEAAISTDGGVHLIKLMVPVYKNNKVAYYYTTYNIDTILNYLRNPEWAKNIAGTQPGLNFKYQTTKFVYTFKKGNNIIFIEK